MPEENRRIIISRANRMLRQSRSIRKLSERLLKESDDLQKESDEIRSSVEALADKRRNVLKKGKS